MAYVDWKNFNAILLSISVKQINLVRCKFRFALRIQIWHIDKLKNVDHFTRLIQLRFAKLRLSRQFNCKVKRTKNQTRIIL